MGFGNSTRNTSHSRGRNHGTNETVNKGRSTNNSTSDNISHGTSHGYQEVLDNELEPNTFVSGLRTGGRDNSCMVDGIMVRAGGFNKGQKYLPVSFKQS